MRAPFPIDAALTAIAIGYKNTRYIADEVLPRVPVGRQEFKWWEYPIAESFLLPDTKVGRRSEPNLVELSATQQTSATEDFGLDDLIPNNDLDNASEGYNPLGRAIMQLSDYIMLGREKRTADLVTDAAKYPASNKVALVGNAQFSDFANSDPIGVILAGLDACLVRPTRMTLGQAVWTKLSQHPKLLKAVHGNDGDSGIARREQVAALFELEQVNVGQSFVNTAKKGQPAVLARVWPKAVVLHYHNPLADTNQGLTFGFTAQWGDKVAGQMPEPKKGLRGSVRARCGESVKELIVAVQAGYLIADAVA